MKTTYTSEEETLLNDTNNNEIFINDNNNNVDKTKDKPVEYKRVLVWRTIILISLLHIFGIYGFYYAVFYGKWQTAMFTIVLAYACSILGITCGAHRLWSHQSFKATLPLRIVLCIANTYCLQNDVYEWCRDHRVHHKFTETDADPHNAKRGFFFSHMGWLMVKKHPDVIEKGKQVDLSDLWRDPVVRFQRKYYKIMLFIFWFYLPTMLPIWLFDENIVSSFMIGVMFRYLISLHMAWTVNSFAHLYGEKTYDTKIDARENRGVVMFTFGEGYHNYHHTFPYDYSASESTWQYDFNLSTLVIDFLSYLGLAYDLKKVDEKIIRSRQSRTGTGSAPKKSYLNGLIQWTLTFFLFNWHLWLAIIVRFYGQDHVSNNWPVDNDPLYKLVHNMGIA